MLKPCLSCSTPTEGSRCEDCRKPHRSAQVGSARARGYDAAWTRLSKRARRLSPFCQLCGSTDDLQLDHLPIAWERKAAGKTIRLKDTRVLCRQCNVDAGSSRPDSARVRREVGVSRPQRPSPHQTPERTSEPREVGESPAQKAWILRREALGRFISASRYPVAP